MRTIEVAEYGVTPDTVTIEEASALEIASRGALRLHGVSGGRAWLRARQHVGVVVAGEVEVRIRSKVPQGNVLGMLAASTGLVSWLDSDAWFGEQDDLLRSIVAFYARTLTDLFAAGVQRAYREVGDLLVAPRGRIEMAGVVRQAGMPTPVPCRFDEYSTDHLLHRYLVAALDRSLHVPGLEPRVRRLLVRARAELVDVPSMPLPPDAIDRHEFTRLDQRYRPAAALARLVLENLSLDMPIDGHRVRSFTIDMNRLFEQWVTARLPDHLPSGVIVVPQSRLHLDIDDRLSMFPDIEIRRGRRPVYVADTKYKLTSTGLGQISDYYQTFSYATVMGLPEAMLIYCFTDDEVPPVVSEVQRAGVRIRSHALDLRGSHSDLEHQLGALGRVVVEQSAAMA